jgi:apurinic endonuclease (APN1)
MDKYVGAHVSTGGGVANAPLNAMAIGARAFAFFTKNQKRWVSKPYVVEEIEEFKSNLQITGILPTMVMAHAGYLINLGNPGKDQRDRSVQALIDETKRCQLLGVSKLVFHPGSYLRMVSEQTSLRYVAESINIVLDNTKGVVLLIENTAGQGSNLGYSLEHLAYLIELVDDKTRVGICLDTCHLYAAGYDLTGQQKYQNFWKLFNNLVGASYLKGMHLNDSKGELKSHLDRHDSIGRGRIGLSLFKLIMNDPQLNKLPLILETTDPTIWADEIRLLYEMVD